jgi:predicted RNA binding protein YcfA (HicA-like mRNA interferase family)
MGQKMPRVTGRELVKAMAKIGIVPVRQRGSHAQLRGTYRGKDVFTTIPIHNRELPTGTVLGILKDCRITRQEFITLLK